MRMWKSVCWKPMRWRPYAVDIPHFSHIMILELAFPTKPIGTRAMYRAGDHSMTCCRTEWGTHRFPARRDLARMCFDQQPEDTEAGWLCQGRQGFDCKRLIHVSRHTDIL